MKLRFKTTRPNTRGPTEPSLRFAGLSLAFFAACAVFAIGLLLTGAAVQWQQRNALARSSGRFDNHVERLQSDIVRRFNQPVYGLMGARGLYAAKALQPVGRAAFGAYVESRDLATEFPGVRGFGFVEHVLRKDLDAFMASERADQAPGFTVRTSGDAADLYVIKHIEPLSQNFAAWGFDMGSEAVRRDAVNRAIDSGKPTLSGRVALAQDNHHGPGFLYLLPVFRAGSHPATPEQRRAALLGLLFSPIVVEEIMAGAVSSGDGQVDFQLFDAAGEPSAAPIFDSARTRAAPQGDAPAALASGGEPLRASRSFVVGGQTLGLRLTTTALFDAGSNRRAPQWLGLGGALLSTMLAFCVWLLAAGRVRALRMAQAMTADLERLARVARHTSDAVTITDLEGRINWVNDGYSRMTGRPFEAALERLAPALEPLLGPAQANTPSLQDGFKGERCEASGGAPPRWLDVEVQPLNDALGRPAGFMVIESDTTERKCAEEALLRERARLASILEGTHAGTWEWDVQTGDYRCSERWAEMLGWTLAELAPLTGQTWLELAHPDDIGRVGKLLEKHFSGELSYYAAELRLRHRQGHWVWVQDRGRVASWLPDGRPGTMAGTQMDISVRKHAEAELSSSRAFLDRAGRLAGVGGWQIDLGSGAIIWSDETCRIHEMPAGHRPSLDEALGFYTSESRAPVEEAVQKAMRDGTPWDLELQLLTASGRRIWVRAVGEAEHEEGRAVRLVGALQDISARRAMEDQLRRNNALKRSILDNLPCGLSAFDGELRLVAHNRQFGALLELPDALLEAAGDAPATLPVLVDHMARHGNFGPGSVEPIVADIMRKMLAPAVQRHEHRRSNGTTLEVRNAPMPGGGFVSTCTDITEQKRTEAALEATTALLRSVLDAASEVAVIATGRDLLISVFNKGAERMLGYAAEEVLGLHTPALFADPAQVEERSREASLEFGRPIRGPAVLLAPELLGRPREWRFVRKDSSRLVVSMAVTATRAQDGAISGYLGVAHDVTLQKEHEASLREALLRAEAASVAKSQFLANTSHEIRTPMNAILGMLALLQRTALTERQRDYAAKTEGAARSLLGLLNDILDFSKVEAGKMPLDLQPFDIETLLRELAVILEANVGDKPVEVRFDVDPALPRQLVGDGMRLLQILINLGGNAVKFTERGQVAVRLRKLRSDEREVSFAIAVEDTGIGIAAEQHAHVFDGFSQAEASTTRRFGGTGLGLTISKRLVALMGGELRLESTLGVGSRFHFELCLPLARPHERDGHEAPVLSAGGTECKLSAAGLVAPRTGDSGLGSLDAFESHASLPALGGAGPARLPGLRVLLVEDNAINRQVAVELLESEGAVVTLAANGSEGVQAVLQAAERLDAVLMDLQMPVMDGYCATALIREHFDAAQLPIVAMTANAMPGDREACLAAGMNDHVGKPFDLSQLVATLQRHAGTAIRARQDAASAAASGASPAQGRTPAPATALEQAFADAQYAGVDLRGALQRLGGRSDVYLRLLDSFAGDLRGLPAQLDALLARGAREDAVRLMHGYKGLAGTLGVVALARVAGEAEHRLQSEGTGSTTPDLVIAVTAASQAALAALERVAHATRALPGVRVRAPARAPVESDATVAETRLFMQVGELRAVLERADMHALELHARLQAQAWPRVFAQALELLDEAMAALDFRRAVAHCRSLLEIHEPTPP